MALPPVRSCYPSRAAVADHLMRTTSLPSLGWDCSVLTLGGGGIGAVWGATTREECIATVRAAVFQHGVTHLDVAAMYGADREAERVVGLAFCGDLPPAVKITTKCALGRRPAGECYAFLQRSLNKSLAMMRLQSIDLFILHSHIVPDDLGIEAAQSHTPWTLYREGFIPAVERLKSEGLIKAWGITGIGMPNTVIQALSTTPRPAACQCIANCLQSAGSMAWWEHPTKGAGSGSLHQAQASFLDVISAAKENGVAVLGIRAVQAGALTDQIDRDSSSKTTMETKDFERAAPLRAIAAERGVSTAFLAHQYSLSMGVDSVILGVKNRTELAECVAAANATPLSAGEMQRIDGDLSSRQRLPKL